MKPLCLAPFKGVYINPEGFSPCCYIPPKRYNSMEEYESSEWLLSMQEGQLTHDYSKMHTRCKSCINDKTNSSFYTEMGYGKSVRSTLEYDAGNLAKTHLYIATSIRCGMSCTMCLVSDKRLSELEETGIKKEMDIYGDFDYNIDVEENIIEWVINNTSGVEILSIYGGDPTMHTATPTLLNNVSDDTTLRYSTNGQFMKLRDGTDLIERLSKFKRTLLTFSIDGLGEIGKRVRKGIVYKNIDRLMVKARDKEIIGREICFTVSLYNVMHSVDIFEELYQKYIVTGLATSLFFNPTLDPEFCAVKNLPYKLKNKVLKSLSEYYLNADLEKRIVLDRSYHNLVGYIKGKQERTEWNNFIRFCIKEEKELELTPISTLIPDYKEYFLKYKESVIDVKVL